MTYISSIHQLLSIEDKNITFDEKLLLPTVKIKDTTYRQLSGKLSYTPLVVKNVVFKITIIS